VKPALHLHLPFGDAPELVEDGSKAALATQQDETTPPETVEDVKVVGSLLHVQALAGAFVAPTKAPAAQVPHTAFVDAPQAADRKLDGA